MPGGEQDVDVLIVGAGLSGIGAAYHLQERCPGKSYAILEAREAHRRHVGPVPLPRRSAPTPTCTLSATRSGPGPTRRRSPTAPRSCATSARPPRRRHRPQDPLRHRVVNAEWSSDDARWTVDAERTDSGETVALTCGFLFVNSGYYRYDQGYTPEFPGLDRFSGQVVHPQHWPEDLDYAGKRVVVIGSGATAMTLVPGDGGGRRARDDAAALADLHRLDARRRRARRPLARASCRTGSPIRSCAGRTSSCRESATSSAAAGRS